MKKSLVSLLSVCFFLCGMISVSAEDHNPELHKIGERIKQAVKAGKITEKEGWAKWHAVLREHEEGHEEEHEGEEEEKDWAEYLFKDGSMIGLNTQLLNQYVEYIANRRLKALNYTAIFDQPVNTNPLPWTQHWLSSSGLQVAPQETENESYIVGGIKQDVTTDSIKGFSL